jgi:hypothetical protein
LRARHETRCITDAMIADERKRNRRRQPHPQGQAQESGLTNERIRPTILASTTDSPAGPISVPRCTIVARQTHEMAATTPAPGPVLPLRAGPIRFMVVGSDGKNSNTWKFWTEPSGDAYLLCRDNFKDAKVSLHTSGRWRIAWDEKAVANKPELVAPGQDRAWEKWEPPPPVEPGLVAAVRMLFPTSELAVEPEQRVGKVWRTNKLAIEAAPIGSGKLTAVTLFVSDEDVALKHRFERSQHFASLPLGDGGRRAHLVAHAEDEGKLPELLDRTRRAALAQWPEGNELPSDGYVYFWGHQPDGARMLVGARLSLDG